MRLLGFIELFCSNSGNYDDILSYVQPSIDLEDNTCLTRTLEVEEFKKALFEMHSDKAPGLDGMNLTFFKRF